ncbi:hypothetical protein [Zooshikella sp. RANM57]|uniref:hypothetical protein n=1 Tax=Zooshikella sp. RANM57 TaxID=3425863 RepID=UPI003D6EFC71
MEVFGGLLILLFFVVLLAGLIKPSLVFLSGERTRKRVLKVYGGSYLLLCIFVALLLPKTKHAGSIASNRSEFNVHSFVYMDKTLSEYRSESKAKRHEIVGDYIQFRSISDSASDVFYACLSHMSYTKDGSLGVLKVLDWCHADYIKNPELLLGYVNFDNFESQFSPWSGAHRGLERVIKESMHDDDSYEHIETKYRLILSEQPKAIVSTTFSGRNAFNAIVKQTVTASVSLDTGQVLKVIR